jgi:hypothetical protein
MGGVMAGYVIHMPPNLTVEEEAEARRVGPSEVKAVGSPTLQAQQAEFEPVEQQDVTQEFQATCRALQRARAEHEEALREEHGDEWFDEEGTKTAEMIDAIERGILRRSLVVARKREW